VFALIRADQLMTPFANTVRAEAVTNQLILEFEWVALEAFICRGLMKLPQRRRLLVLVRGGGAAGAIAGGAGAAAVAAAAAAVGAGASAPSARYSVASCLPDSTSRAVTVAVANCRRRFAQ